LPFWNKGTNGDYGIYLTRRFFRIYVPFATVVLISALGSYLLGSHPLPLGWFYHDTWQTPVSAQLILGSLFLRKSHELNNALWSLRIELQVSIVFPVLLLLVKRLRPALTILSAAALVAVGGHFGATKRTPPFLYLDTLRYAGMFMLGATLAQKRAWIRAQWERVHALTITLLSLSSAWLFWGYGEPYWRYIHLKSIPDLQALIGACGLILCALNLKWFSRMLMMSVPEYLGRISYSLYLMHEVVLYSLTTFLYGKIPLFYLGAIYLITVLPIAHLFCIGVEEPSLRTGKRIVSKRFARSALRA
jgi:peptidoglycan/LPS O-acetylase OafA/YrhL